jgi:hypothetical protein
VHRSYLSKLETNAAEPSFDLLKRMAEVYACELGDLFLSADSRGAEFKPLMAELFGIAPHHRGMIIRHISNLTRALATAYAEKELTGVMGRETPIPVTPTSEDVAKKEDRATLPVGLARRPTLGDPQEKQPEQRTTTKRRGRTSGRTARLPRRPAGDEGKPGPSDR